MPGGIARQQSCGCGAYRQLRYDPETRMTAVVIPEERLPMPERPQDERSTRIRDLRRELRQLVRHQRSA